MRRRIRFTGRKQLPHSSVEVKIFRVGEPKRKLISLSVLNKKPYRSFPGNAKVKLRLFENKFSETLEFGSLEAPSQTAYLNNTTFSAPSCQLRIVASDDHNKGLLLGSTRTWTLRDSGEEEDSPKQGILMFVPGNIAPQTWKLDIRPDEYPVVYIDRNIKNSGIWARNDPVFISCVLPAIVREVFEGILDSEEPSEQEWSRDWLRWAEFLMPGAKTPSFEDDDRQKMRWIDHLLDSFCHKHQTLKMLEDHLNKET